MLRRCHNGLGILAALCAVALTTDEHAGAAPPTPAPATPPRAKPPYPVARKDTFQAPPRTTAYVAPAVAPVTMPSFPPFVLSHRAAFPNPSFESARLDGWTSQGSSGPAQPVPASARRRSEKESVPSDRLRIAGQLPAQLGGDYWKVPFTVTKTAIGQQGNVWLEATGKLTSPTFALNSGERWLTFIVKGASPSTKLTAAVLAADGSRVFTSTPQVPVGRFGPVILDLALVPGDKRGALRVEVSMLSAGDGVDDFQIWRTQPDAAGLVAPSGANVAAGVWGIADLHTHLFNQMGFGGRMFAGAIHSSMNHRGLISGISARTGRPFSDSPSNLEDALKRCHDNHGSAPDGNGTLTLFVEGGHNQAGYPDFIGSPRFSSLMHQQAYVDWIKRAWRGGLRLVHVDVGNSAVLASLYTGVMGAIPGFGGAWNPFDDGWAIDAEVKAMHDFVRLPDVRDWVEIAESPEDARRIISAGKLAFVLGVEVDDMGNLTKELRARNTDGQRTLIRQYLDALIARGVKHLIPIHIIENGFGAPAVYELMFDLENRLVNGRWFPIRDAFASGIRTQLNVPVDDILRSSSILNWVAHTFDPGDMDKLSALSSMHGHAHAQGLATAGKILVQEAMRRGMILDIDHMSDLSADETLSLAEKVQYPVVSSHTGFRELAFGSWKKDGGNWVPNTNVPFTHGNAQQLGADTEELMAKERDRSLSHLNRIRALGGMVGIGAGASMIPVAWPNGSTRAPQNCDGSSAVFAQLLRYANDKMNGRGIAIGTDLNGLNGMANPRFGPYACYAASSDSIRKTGLRGQADAQQHPVRYRDGGMANNPMGIRAVNDVRFYAPNGAYTNEYEESVTWEALARFKAGMGNSSWGPASVSTIWDGHDFGRDVVRMAYGFHLASTGHPRGDCPNCGLGDTHPDVDSAWDVWHGRDPRSDYAGIKPVYAAWKKLETTGTNEPLEKNIAGRADFDVNIDGFAHYGLLPDFLQDVKNLGITDSEMAPLFRSAEDYVIMWETIEAQRAAAAAQPDVCSQGHPC